MQVSDPLVRRVHKGQDDGLLKRSGIGGSTGGIWDSPVAEFSRRSAPLQRESPSVKTPLLKVETESQHIGRSGPQQRCLWSGLPCRFLDARTGREENLYLRARV
jgi:hypothetical protein